MKSLLLSTIAVAVLAIPAISFAATYQYVNTQGGLETVVANTAEEALALPTDMDPHSGVMLVTGANTTVTTPVVTNSVTGTYSYQMSGSSNVPARMMYLSLLPNSSVILTSIYGNATPTMIETGSWSVNALGQVQVMLTGNTAGNNITTYSPTRSLVFSQNGSSLNATNYDSTLYGTTAPVFSR
jgi:hypothetical protein